VVGLGSSALPGPLTLRGAQSSCAVAGAFATDCDRQGFL